MSIIKRYEPLKKMAKPKSELASLIFESLPKTQYHIIELKGPVCSLCGEVVAFYEYTEAPVRCLWCDKTMFGDV